MPPSVLALLVSSIWSLDVTELFIVKKLVNNILDIHKQLNVYSNELFIRRWLFVTTPFLVRHMPRHQWHLKARTWRSWPQWMGHGRHLMTLYLYWPCLMSFRHVTTSRRDILLDAYRRPDSRCPVRATDIRWHHDRAETTGTEGGSNWGPYWVKLASILDPNWAPYWGPHWVKLGSILGSTLGSILDPNWAPYWGPCWVY